MTCKRIENLSTRQCKIYSTHTWCEFSTSAAT